MAQISDLPVRSYECAKMKNIYYCMYVCKAVANLHASVFVRDEQQRYGLVASECGGWFDGDWRSRGALHQHLLSRYLQPLTDIHTRADHLHRTLRGGGQHIIVK